ncbi:hypothetical protein CP335_25860 [Pseudomonas fluorescens]|uniref:Uncharacterized protein n=1 Tax=Pseudomonas fluorescens TaxID=294 RepID=A0A854WXD5_PSEFL|nr:hypothetical protein CP335_25860 [Pseudomonas fluorescens]
MSRIARITILEGGSAFCCDHTLRQARQRVEGIAGQRGGQTGPVRIELGLGQHHKTCGSWLASDSGVSANESRGSAGLIAGKPAPTG